MSQHPVSLFESMLDVLGDAIVVAPLIRSGMIHSRKGKRSYFYNFAYSANSDSSNENEQRSSSSSSSSSQYSSSSFPSRFGASHGHELPFVFGLPLLPAGYPLGLLDPSLPQSISSNTGYTRAETVLSESVMSYFSNFVKFGSVSFFEQLSAVRRSIPSYCFQHIFCR